MELIERNLKLLRKAPKTDSTIAFEIASIAAIEVELNRLKGIFSVAGFLLAEHEVETLSGLCRMHAKLKFEIVNHLQELRMNSLHSKRLISSKEMNLNSALERELGNLKERLDRFTERLFKKPVGKRDML